MEINIEYLNQHYQEIWETTNKKGIPIPYLLKNNVNKDQLNNDIDNLKLSNEIKEKLGEAYINRRKKETDIYRENKGVKKRRELLEEYMENELIEWVKKFPQYNNILQY